jgi:hypothetical protein
LLDEDLTTDAGTLKEVVGAHRRDAERRLIVEFSGEVRDIGLNDLIGFIALWDPAGPAAAALDGDWTAGTTRRGNVPVFRVDDAGALCVPGCNRFPKR